jgi:hypothetical protein
MSGIAPPTPALAPLYAQMTAAAQHIREARAALDRIESAGMSFSESTAAFFLSFAQALSAGEQMHQLFAAAPAARTDAEAQRCFATLQTEVAAFQTRGEQFFRRKIIQITDPIQRAFLEQAFARGFRR